MHVARSPDHLKAISDHPRVRAYIGGDGVSPADPGASWDRSVALEWEEGGIIFTLVSQGVYSAHLVFAPKTQDTVGKCKDALTYLFTHTDARRVVGKTPRDIRHAIRLARNVGMRHLFDTPQYSFCEMTRGEWQQQHKDVQSWDGSGRLHK